VQFGLCRVKMSVHPRDHEALDERTPTVLRMHLLVKLHDRSPVFEYGSLDFSSKQLFTIPKSG
jgi:hypothetical protein